jgi:hypothetical protein
MLIYNSKKEFLGIDEEDLKTLGFSNLAELQTEAAHFEDLFLRTPGYIHNFKYVHWIDYIVYGDSTEQPKAILHTKNRDFFCNLKVTATYMSDDPSSKAYIIYLENLKALSSAQAEAIVDDIAKKEFPVSIALDDSPKAQEIDTEAIKQSIAKENNLLFATEVPQTLTDTKEIHPKEEIIESIDTPLDIEDVTVETPIALQEEIEKSEEIKVVEVVEDSEEVKEVETVTLTDEKTKPKYPNDYIYDPQVASDELGLPIDLIEEFIGDFIAQAKEFKNDLYKSIKDEDINNLKILSHKLKGVAANLRIEDALEVLTTANTSNDLSLVKENLDYLYVIIARLEGKEGETQELPVKNDEKEDEFILDFKDEKEEVPLIDVDYDKAKVAKEIGIDSDTFDSLFNSYIGDAQEIIKNMKQLIASNDLIHLKKHIVKLQGMNRNMRIDNFSNELQTLIDTPNQDVATEAINKINSVILSMKG